jgi:hypothetical protein
MPLYFINCIALLMKQDSNELNVRAPDMPYIPSMMYGSFLHIGYGVDQQVCSCHQESRCTLLFFPAKVGAETMMIVDSLNHQINSSGLLRFYSLLASNHGKIPIQLCIHP